MVDVSDARIDAAVARGGAVRAGEPRAEKVRYDRKTGHVTVGLRNGCSFSFPAALVQGLREAAAEDLAGVEILGDGFGLHWEALDVDISVPGLLSGVFGTASYMAARAGAVKSPAKAAAARANGAKGGRPRKAG